PVLRPRKRPPFGKEARLRSLPGFQEPGPPAFRTLGLSSPSQPAIPRSRPQSPSTPVRVSSRLLRLVARPGAPSILFSVAILFLPCSFTLGRPNRYPGVTMPLSRKPVSLLLTWLFLAACNKPPAVKEEPSEEQRDGFAGQR